MGPTGVSSTSSVGTLGFELMLHLTLTGVSATSSVGSVDAEDVIITNWSICNFFCRISSYRNAYDITGVSATDFFRINRRKLQIL